MVDDTRGKARHVKGEIKEKAGEILGDRELEREGRLGKAEGKAEQDEQRAEEAAREARERKARARVEREGRED